MYIKRKCKKKTGQTGNCAVISHKTQKQKACYDDCDTARSATHIKEEFEEDISNNNKLLAATDPDKEFYLKALNHIINVNKNSFQQIARSFSGNTRKAAPDLNNISLKVPQLTLKLDDKTQIDINARLGLTDHIKLQNIKIGISDTNLASIAFEIDNLGQGPFPGANEVNIELSKEIPLNIPALRRIFANPRIKADFRARLVNKKLIDQEGMISFVLDL